MRRRVFAACVIFSCGLVSSRRERRTDVITSAIAGSEMTDAKVSQLMSSTSAKVDCDCGECTVLNHVTDMPKRRRADLYYLFSRPEEWGSVYNDCGSSLGSGSFGHVLLVQKKNGGDAVALKIQKDTGDSRNEVVMLQRFFLQPNIIQIVAASSFTEGYWGQKYALIAMEKANGDLEDCKDATPEAKLALFRSTLLGLKQMHAEGIAHRDLKLDNVFYFGTCEDGKAKLADVSKACVTSWQSWGCRKVDGTPLYLAPELLNYRFMPSAACSNDMWAAGLILHQLVFLEFPAPIEKADHTPYLAQAIIDMPVYEQYARDLPDEWSHLSSSVLPLLSGLLKPDVTDRLSAEDALKLFPQ